MKRTPWLVPLAPGVAACGGGATSSTPGSRSKQAIWICPGSARRYIKHRLRVLHTVDRVPARSWSSVDLTLLRQCRSHVAAPGSSDACFAGHRRVTAKLPHGWNVWSVGCRYEDR